MLEIAVSILKAMIDQARRQAPIEACGILAGRCDRADRLYEMTNADAAIDHFTMVPQEQFQVAKAMRGEGLEMLAVYHSHPASPARPSQEDVRLALTPGVIHVILSLAETEPMVKGFRIEGGVVTEVAVGIVGR